MNSRSGDSGEFQKKGNSEAFISYTDDQATHMKENSTTCQLVVICIGSVCNISEDGSVRFCYRESLPVLSPLSGRPVSAR